MISGLGLRVLRPVLRGKATVLEALTIRLLDIIHLETLESSKLAKLSLLSKSFPVIKCVVSSAKNLGVVSKHEGRSFMQIRKKSGSKMAPWGIPSLICFFVDVVDANDTH